MSVLLSALFWGVIACLPARALPPFWAAFQQTYLPKEGTPLTSARCQTCHVSPGGGERNVYGRLIESALKEAQSAVLTPAILKQTEAIDSDGDGWSNGAEITARTLPGDPASHPSGRPKGRTTTPRAAQQAKPTFSSPLLPLHSYHPTIVHFPIALFMFGGLLELLGERKRRPDLRAAGFLNLAVGSLTSLLSVATGFIAAYRNAFALQGILLTHMGLGVASAVGMLATALVGWSAMRRGRERNSPLYWVLLIVSALLVGATGHFGGLFVFGS